MYRIKEKPEDFVVKEKLKLKKVRIEKGEGSYSYFLMKKRNYTTQKAIDVIARKLGLPAKFFGYAGNKDKRAVTEQFVSVKNCSVKELKLNDISLGFAGKGKEPISLGDLDGNYFEIVVRNVDKKPKKINKFPNYFGEQRFSKQNIEVGRVIIKKDFRKACELLELDVVKNDFVGALRNINKKILRLYVHAYQSYLWNETAREYLRLSKKNIKIPIVGFGTEIKDKKLKEIIEKIMKNEKIVFMDFVIRQIPELSSEGSERELFAKVIDLEIEKGSDFIKLKFFLKKGCYATVFVDCLFNSL